MSERIFTDEERESAKRNRREALRRLADEASATVDRLLAEGADCLPAWAQSHAEKARTGRQSANFAAFFHV